MHVNQKPRRRHSEQFKAQVLAACAEPGASVSAVALSFGVNDNLVHQWRRGRGYRAQRRVGAGGEPGAAAVHGPVVAAAGRACGASG